MNNDKLANKFYEDDVRVDKLIHVASALSDSASEDLKEFFEEDWNIIEKALGVQIHQDYKNSLDDCDSYFISDSISEIITSYAKFGFIAQFATPVMTWKNESSGSFSWGLSRAEWVYAETVEELYEKGFKWVESVREKEKKKIA